MQLVNAHLSLVGGRWGISLSLIFMWLIIIMHSTNASLPMYSRQYYADAWSETEFKALVLFTFIAIATTGPLIIKRNIGKQLLPLLEHKPKQHFSVQVK